jgi:cation diffusion facilitator CzcD-associated flavoprotein CzcO
MVDKTQMRVGIIGAGPAGIAAGHELLAKGFTQFTIFDALDAPGGTWRLHSYPGLACDVWAHSYTFSYAPNPDWSASFVGQAEIQAYLARCATQFGLDPHMKLNTRITAARFMPEKFWRLETEAGEQFDVDVVINAMGNQHTPLFPDVPGMDEFQGESFHGTRWDHNVDLAGKRVGVIGSAASAVQIVPSIADTVGHMTVLQRSANWIMPRGKKDYSDRQRKLFRRFPFLLKLVKRWQGLLMGQVGVAVTHGHKRMEQFETVAKKYIARSVDDPQLQAALTPDSRYGCKRGLVSDDFYAALTRDNVELIPAGLKAVTPTGIVTSDDREIELDVIIYCTGYKVLDYDRFDVVGEHGVKLADALADDPQVYKGIAAAGFPNYFFAVGPNGLVLNVSYFITAERNIETIVGLLDDLVQAGGKTMSVKPQVAQDYHAWMGEQFERFSWGSSDCNSYYRNASGHAPFLFPGTFKEYDALHERSGLHEYDVA